MSVDVSYASALGAGILSFLSPCVLPLVPPYLCYMAGVSVRDLENANEQSGDASSVQSMLMRVSIAFVFGFSTVFIVLGASAFAVSRLVHAWLEPLSIIAGVFIIIMGLNFLGVFRLTFLAREARFQSQGKPTSILAAYVMGLAFAFGWAPCIGPVLTGILFLAGNQDTAFEGALVLATYSAGLGIPFLIAAYFSSAFMRFLKRFRMHLGKVEKIMGGMLVIAGILFLTGGMQKMSFWLLENFQIFQQLG